MASVILHNPIPAAAQLQIPVIGCLEQNCFNEVSYKEFYATKKLKTFHEKIINIFSKLPSHNKAKEVAVRCLLATIAILVYSILGLFFVGEFLFSKIRNPKFEAELARLRAAKILTPTVEAQIDSSIRKSIWGMCQVNPEELGTIVRRYCGANRKEVKILFSQALEIKRAYEKEYYVFTHGQSSKWYVVSQLIKILVQKSVHCNSSDNFEYLRSTKHKSALTPQEYKSAINQNAERDHDREVRGSLVSSDVHFFNSDTAESALYYVIANINQLTLYERFSKTVIKDTCQGIIQQYLPNANIRKISECAEKIAQIAKKIDVTCGHFFVTCIKKTLFKEKYADIGYISHCHGDACECHSGEDRLTVMDELQKDSLKPKHYCYSRATPQFRLMGNFVRPENEVKSFLLSSLSTKNKQAVLSEIDNHVTKLFTEMGSGLTF